jgi:TolB-like protein/class 3 adenylate cyclase
LAREQRRLAAILFADAVGSSLLMGRDESGIVARLLQHLNQRLAPAVARHGGRVIRLKGDGALVEFASAVDALAAAIEFQQAMIEANRDELDDKAIVFRIGLHLGDVIVEGDDIYGDAVNVAARLESEAPPGGILVSRAVREAVTGRLKVSLHALGELALKNIERPIRAFRVEWSVEDWPAHPVASGAAASPKEPAPALPLPGKPSIAVLPFQNMSGDPEQEYFADGIVEDIITALSRTKALFVIARNSSFTFKGRAVDVRDVGRQLGVRYVLEGSVRKSANRVRITAQLVDASSGSHMWADRFEGSLESVFDLQDDVASRVVAAIGRPIGRAEMVRSRRKPTEELRAYDYYLRASSCFYPYFGTQKKKRSRKAFDL